MPMTTSTFPSLLVKGLYDCAIDSFKAHEKLLNRVTKPISERKGPYVELKRIPNLPLIPEHQEGKSKALVEITEGHLKRITPKIYAAAMAITEVMLKDDQYGIIMEIPQGFGASAAETREIVGWNEIFNNAFTTSTADDGNAIFYDSHTWYPGSATYDNLGAAAAFGVESLWNCINQMRKMKDSSGKQLGIVPDTIIYGIDLDRTVDEVLSSEYFPDDNRNAVNAVRKFSLKRICVPWITSTTAWGLIDSRSAKLHRWDLWPVTFGHDGDFMTDNSLFSVKMRFGVGVQHGVGYLGNAGA